MDLLTLEDRFPLFKESFHSLLSVSCGYVYLIVLLFDVVAFRNGEMHALVNSQLGAAQGDRGIGRNLARQH